MKKNNVVLLGMLSVSLILSTGCGKNGGTESAKAEQVTEVAQEEVVRMESAQVETMQEVTAQAEGKQTESEQEADSQVEMTEAAAGGVQAQAAEAV